MSAQSEALRLADSISRIDTLTEHQRGELLQTAAELRRLHIENEAFGLHLSERMKDLAKVEAQRDALLEALRKCSEQLTRLGYSANHADQAIAAIKQAEENT